LPSNRPGGAGSVVVIGAGFVVQHCPLPEGGQSRVDVTLVERERASLTCPFSNGVIAGYNTMADITRSLDGVRAAGVKIVAGESGRRR